MAIVNRRLAMIGVFGFFGKRYTPAHTVRGRPTIKTVERFRKGQRLRSHKTYTTTQRNLNSHVTS